MQLLGVYFQNKPKFANVQEVVAEFFIMTGNMFIKRRADFYIVFLSVYTMEYYAANKKK